MRGWLTSLCAVLLLGASWPGLAGGQDKGEAKLTCVTWKTEAKFSGFAYNHLVHFHNRCAHAVSCAVKTDINPKTETVSLAKGEKKTVLTFRGSPARKFKAEVKCKM
jgi:hypothetical protein